MKYLLLAVVVSAALLGLGLLMLARHSRKAPMLGLANGRLRACPEAKNCVSSEPGGGGYADVEPLRFSGDPAEAWRRVLAAVAETGGVVLTAEDRYVRATYRTGVFGFVDDLELRLVPEDSLIHVRAASRVGHSDLGKNKSRVEALREAFGA